MNLIDKMNMILIFSKKSLNKRSNLLIQLLNDDFFIVTTMNFID